MNYAKLKEIRKKKKITQEEMAQALGYSGKSGYNCFEKPRLEFTNDAYTFYIKRKGNMMLWVQKMNNIRNRATEIVNAELIYTV